MRSVILLMFCSVVAFAQPGSNVLDGIYIPENSLSRTPVNYTYVGEHSLKWTKRIWRVIDLREKINHPYYYPLEPTRNMRSLITVVRDGICSGELTSYEAMSDEFLYQNRGADACALGTSVDTAWIDTDGDGIEDPVAIPNSFEYAHILRFRIKEDWYFDKNRSVMKARIIGICPIETMYDEFGEYKGERPLYWIYFPELRPMLSTALTPNRHNDVERRSYDDLFEKRLFSSYIYQESNPYGRKIQDYKMGLDIQLESKAIENKLFDYEQDLWEY